VGLYIPEYGNMDQGLSYGFGGGEWNGHPGQQSQRGSKMVGKINILNKKKLFSALKKKLKFESNIREFHK
jgi:hypothetical protein